MSMLTSFCDDLTLRADELDECHMIPHADAMREAAEMIRYLREFGIENAKLRDLLRELYFCSRQIGCDKCRYRRSFNGKLCETLDELRELGIEVSDG